MSKFKVTATMYTDLEIQIEAENEAEAYRIAKETDGGSYTEIPRSGEWQIGDIALIEEELNNDQ